MIVGDERSSEGSNRECGEIRELGLGNIGFGYNIQERGSVRMFDDSHHLPISQEETIGLI